MDNGKENGNDYDGLYGGYIIDIINYNILMLDLLCSKGPL